MKIKDKRAGKHYNYCQIGTTMLGTAFGSAFRRVKRPFHRCCKRPPDGPMETYGPVSSCGAIVSPFSRDPPKSTAAGESGAERGSAPKQSRPSHRDARGSRGAERREPGESYDSRAFTLPGSCELLSTMVLVPSFLGDLENARGASSSYTYINHAETASFCSRIRQESKQFPLTIYR